MKIAAFVIVVSAAVWSQGPAETEAIVKAAYLYNFGLYTQWPRPIEQFRIGIVGRSSLETALDQVARSKKIRDEPIRILHFETPEDITDCEILFVDNGEHLSKALALTRGRSVLIVGHEEGLARKGAMFNFFIEDGKVKFEINRKSLERERLRVDFRVLKLGKLVEDETETSTVQ